MENEPKPKPVEAHATTTGEKEIELKLLIQRYIDQYLPFNEPRIQEKMYPSCKVVVVIPAYGERNYILRPLATLAQQDNVGPKEYEVIIVVNNPPSPPQRLTNEKEEVYLARLRHYEEAIVDNQATIKILNNIKSSGFVDKPSDNLNIQESQLARIIKESGLVFHVIDKASEGKMLPPDQANVGGARNRGVAEAVARFVDLNNNGIIAQSDADIGFYPDYIANLVKQYQDNPEIIGFRGAVELETEVDRKTVPDKVTETTKIKRLYKNLLQRYKDIYGVSYGRKADQDRDGNEPLPVFWGSNMSSRAFQTALVGGVPLMGAGEDPAFGERLSTIGKIGFAKDVKVTQLSRVSARAEGGHGIGILKAHSKLARGLNVEVENPFMIPHIELLIQTIQNELSVYRKKPSGRAIVEIITEFLTSQAISFRENRLTELVSYIDSDSVITNERLYDFLRKATKVPLEQAVNDLLANIESQTNLKDSSEYRDLVTMCRKSST